MKIRRIGVLVLFILSVAFAGSVPVTAAPYYGHRFEMDENGRWVSHQCGDPIIDVAQIQISQHTDGTGARVKICQNYQWSGSDIEVGMCWVPWLGSPDPFPEFCDDSHILCQCANDQASRLSIHYVRNGWRVQLREHWPYAGWSFTRGPDGIGFSYPFTGGFAYMNDELSTIRFYQP